MNRTAGAELGKVHLVGIGGAGMSGIARVLLARGTQVSGSDAKAFSSSTMPFVGVQFATHKTATRRPRRRSSGRPSSNGRSHPGGTNRMRSSGTPDRRSTSTRPWPAAMKPFAWRYAERSSAPCATERNRP